MFLKLVLLGVVEKFFFICCSRYRLWSSWFGLGLDQLSFFVIQFLNTFYSLFKCKFIVTRNFTGNRTIFLHPIIVSAIWILCSSMFFLFFFIAFISIFHPTEIYSTIPLFSIALFVFIFITATEQTVVFVKPSSSWPNSTPYSVCLTGMPDIRICS